MQNVSVYNDLDEVFLAITEGKAKRGDYIYYFNKKEVKRGRIVFDKIEKELAIQY
jgi:hypothetical protein